MYYSKGEINNTEIDHAKYIDVVIPMYNLIEFSDKYSKTSGNLWEYCRNEPALNNDGVIVHFSNDTDNASFKYKQKITGDKSYGTKEGTRELLKYY